MDLQTASWVLGLIGAGQVLGRLLYLALPHTTAPWIAPSVVGLLGATVLVGFAAAAHPIWIFSTAIVAGAVRGALTLRAGLRHRGPLGSRSYGRLNGMLAGPVAALSALAPGAAAILAASLGSYSAMGFVMAAVCAVGGLLVIRRRTHAS